MQIDAEHDDNDDGYFDNLQSPLLKSLKSKEFLSKKEFDYAITLLDDKINAIYKLCRFISDQQQKNTMSIQKLVAVDELSDDFWNVSYFNIFNIFTLILR
jgi:hypothetical protein